MIRYIKYQNLVSVKDLSNFLHEENILSEEETEVFRDGIISFLHGMNEQYHSEGLHFASYDVIAGDFVSWAILSFNDTYKSLPPEISNKLSGLAGYFDKYDPYTMNPKAYFYKEFTPIQLPIQNNMFNH